MIKVSFNKRIHRGPGEYRGVIFAAGWHVAPNNVARIVPDNWRVL